VTIFVTIVRSGYLVLDASGYPFEPNSMHTNYSCTRSITSAMIGVAIEQGFTEGVEQAALSFFSDRGVSNLDVQKEAMTLEDRLIMASGMACRDPYLYEWRGLNEMWRTDDWTQFVADLLMAEPSGDRVEYCNGASLLLAAIIQVTTCMGAATFAEEQLCTQTGDLGRGMALKVSANHDRLGGITYATPRQGED
jgi:CubicO group peptidase (beta-lactamase class C family)